MSTSMNQSDREKAYGTIKNARALNKALKPSIASSTSKSLYAQEFKRLVAKCSSSTPTPEGMFEVMRSTRSKRTYYMRRAAARHVIQEGLMHTLQEQDRQQAAGDMSSWEMSIKKIEFLMELHTTLERYGDRCPITSPAKKRSKRQMLHKLPDDFRETMYDKMANSKYRLPYLVAALTGCRPQELEYGIKLTEADGKLRLHIIGAKVIEGGIQGQAWRELEYSIRDDHPLIAAALRELRSHGNNEILISVASKDAYTASLRRVGRMLWPRMKSEVTGYCLRHFSASCWKAAGLSMEQLAMALGHSVTRTQSLYGQAQIAKSRGSGMLLPTSVRAAAPVRNTRTAHPGTKVSQRPRG
jgi:integrase